LSFMFCSYILICLYLYSLLFICLGFVVLPHSEGLIVHQFCKIVSQYLFKC
jgi:hypothetical protein